jgi:hypothetical protein
LAFNRGGWVEKADPIAPGCAIAVVFFENEAQAIARARTHVNIDRVVRLDLTSLPSIREQLGVRGLINEICVFAAMVVRKRGVSYLRRSSIPLLGWLLFKSFAVLFREKDAITVITTNMQHPASIGIHWAARLAGRDTAFVEHATTPAVVVSDRGYGRWYVNFEHTRSMLTARNAPADRVHVMSGISRVAERRSAGFSTVGVCINDLDSADSVAAITAVLLQRAFKVVYRLHDADPRLNHFRREAARHGIAFSSARASRIETFLAEVDVIVAGNSNVVADALMAGTAVVYYWDGAESLFDYYGLIGFYRLPYARSKQELSAVFDRLGGRC